MWQYIGRNWFRNGLTPYKGGIDNKSPLLFAIYGLSDYILGVNTFIPRIIGIICQTSGLYFVYKIGNLNQEVQSGKFAIIIYGLSILWRSTGGQYVSYSESYSEFFTIVSFYYCLRSIKSTDYLLSGVFGALAVLFRLTAIFGVLAIFILLIKKRTKKIFIFCAAGLTISILIGLILIYSGIHIQDFILYGFKDNFDSGGITDHSMLSRFESLVNAFFYSEMVLFFPGLIIYIYLQKKIDPYLLWFLLSFLGISLIGLFTRVHMKELLPQLSLINAFVLYKAFKKYNLPQNLTIVVLWISFFPKSLEPIVCLKQLLLPKTQNQVEAENSGDAVKKKAGLWIKANSNENDLVLVAGYGSIVQAYSERVSPSIYFNVTQTKIAKDRFFKDITANKATLIAIPTDENYRKLVQKDIIDSINNLIKTYYLYDQSIAGYDIYKIHIK
jgi:hypothetical protein